MSNKPTSKTLCIICHHPSPNTRSLFEALVRGANHPDCDVITRALSPFDAKAEDVTHADALILGTTENFGYMSGALKDFFDRIYYPCLEQTQGKPYALMIRAGIDGTGTKHAVNRIVSGLGWKPVQAELLCKGEFRPEFIDQCEEFGLTMAAGLDAGIF